MFPERTAATEDNALVDVSSPARPSLQRGIKCSAVNDVKLQLFFSFRQDITPRNKEKVEKERF